MVTKSEALRDLVFDSLHSLQKLKGFVCRIELRKEKESKKLVIVFSNFFALQKWKEKEALILARMRELYKERGLKEVVVFNEVLAEMRKQNRFYKERSSCEFEILSHSQAVRAIFERIQVAIKENLERERKCISM